MKVTLENLEIHTSDDKTPPPAIKMAVRYSSKNIIIDTQQKISSPFSINQPKSWMWFVLWPSIVLPLTEAHALDGFIIYTPGYAPLWCGWDILDQKSASITLSKDTNTSFAFESFITSNLGKSTSLPDELKSYFNVSDKFDEKVSIK